MILNKFIEEVGMKAQFDAAAFSVSLALIIMAVMLCFYGVKLFKAFSSIIIFVLTGLFFLLVMKKADIGDIVALFTILGLLMAAVTYKWYTLSAFIIGMFIGFSFTAPFAESFWINFAVGVAFGVAANVFPVIAIIIMTAVWGSFYFTIAGAELFNINISEYLTALLFVFFSMVGIMLQYLPSKDLLKLTLKERRRAIFK